MVTKVVEINGSKYIYIDNKAFCRHAEYYGKSTDIKPVEGVNNSDVFYEMDTKKVFLFDEESQT